MTSNPIELISAGTYYVEVTDANLCVKEFGPFVVKEVTALDENYGFELIKLVANPYEKLIYIELQSKTNENLTISIKDVYNHSCLLKQFTEKQIQSKLDVRNLPAGIYFICIQSGNQQKVIKFLWY